ncbi:MAG: hypothetical protein FJX62_19535 [Alphaproteobacteria bacterium]|nr:hypothetical protein [Alphaproteobacteria bacterium]
MTRPIAEPRSAKSCLCIDATPVRRLLGGLFIMLAALSACPPAQAQYEGLADALDIMSAYRNVHPRAAAAYDELLSRVPPEVRTQVQTADWAAGQARMTPRQLEDAATDNNIRFVRTADGLAAIPAQKLRNAISGLTDFAIDQNEVGEILARAKERFPAAREGVVGQLIGALESARSGRVARFAAAPVVKRLISSLVSNQIDADSESIRDQVLSDAAKAQREAVQQAAEMKQRVQELADRVASASGAAPGGSSPPPAASAATPANDPALIARFDNAFGELDAARARFDQRIAQDQEVCTRTADLLKADNVLGIQGRIDAIQRSVDETIASMLPDSTGVQPLFDTLASTIATLDRIVGQATGAADQVCASSRVANPDLGIVTGGALRVRNLGVLAGQVADDAQAAAGRLERRLNIAQSMQSIPSDEEIRNRFLDRINSHREFCANVRSELSRLRRGGFDPVSYMDGMYGPQGAILGALLEADGGGLTRSLTARYSARLDGHEARVKAIASRIDFSVCKSNGDRTDALCSDDPVILLMRKLADVRKQVIATRDSQADRLSNQKHRIGLILVRLVAAEARASQCLAEADPSVGACIQRQNYEAPDSGDGASQRRPSSLGAAIEACTRGIRGPLPPSPGGEIVLLPPVTPPPVTVTPPPPLPGPLPGPTTGPTGPVGPTGPTTGPTTGPAPAPTAPTTGPSPGASPGQPQDKTKTAAECDPTKVPPPKPDVSPGFVPVPYKGATAWTGATNPDCPPYGPPARGVDDGLAKTDTKPPAGAAAQACGAAEAAIKRGQEHYREGRVTSYRVSLANAERELERLNSPKACAAQREQIGKGAGQATLLEQVINSVDKALATCEENQLRKLSGLLSKTKHPHVAQLRARVDRMAGVAGDVDRADLARAAGKSADAATLYRQASEKLGADRDRCPNLVRRVRDGEQRVRVTSLHYTPEVTPHARATSDCKGRYGTHGMAVPNPDSVTGYTCDCADPLRMENDVCVREKTAHERADAAHGACKSSFGQAAYAQPKDSTYKEYGCLCGKGHAWNANQTQCVEQTQEQVIADANHRCQVANKNKRARAVKYQGNEQWSCVIDRTRAEVMADAHKSCQQANGGDRRVRAGKQLANGQWSCYIPGPRRAATQHQQSQPNYDAAASAAAAAAIIQGLGTLMRHQNTRPPARSGHSHSSCRLNPRAPNC